MPTNKPKSVTIELTPKQREKLRKLTGQAHSEIRVEVSGRTARKPLSAKAAPRTAPPPLQPIDPDTQVAGGLPTA